MADTFRDMCAELLADYDNCHCRSELSNRAHALLDNPEPEGPTDEELDSVMFQAVWGCMDKASDLTNDEMDRLKARAVLARWGRPTPQPEPEGFDDKTREAVLAAVSEALGGGAYDCLRVWSAWGYGTMGPDDFSLVSEDDDRVAEIADAAIQAIRPTPQPLPSGYIDPEHQGQDLALLQAFYQACRAEGGTADEIHLRGIRAVLAAHSTPQPPVDGEVAELVGWLQSLRSPMCNGSEWMASRFDRTASLLLQGQSSINRQYRLQQESARFREPERTILCDLLANGTLLPDPDGKRYGLPLPPTTEVQ